MPDLNAPTSATSRQQLCKTCKHWRIKAAYTRVFSSPPTPIFFSFFFLTHDGFHVYALTHARLTGYTCARARTPARTHGRPPARFQCRYPGRPADYGCCRRSLSGSARLKMTITRGARQTPQETQVPLLRDTQRSKGPNYLLLFWQLSGRE